MHTNQKTDGAIVLTLHRDPMRRVITTENVQKGLNELKRLHEYLAWFVEKKLLPREGLHTVFEEIIESLIDLRDDRRTANYNSFISKFRQLLDRVGKNYEAKPITYHHHGIERLKGNQSILILAPYLVKLGKTLRTDFFAKIWKLPEFQRVNEEVRAEIVEWGKRNIADAESQPNKIVKTYNATLENWDSLMNFTRQT